MSNNAHRRWTTEEKLQIIQEARQTAPSLSEVCGPHGLAAGQFSIWEK